MLAVLYKLRFGLVARLVTLVIFILFPIIQLRQGLGFLAIVFLLDFVMSRNKSAAFFAGLICCASYLTSPEIGLIVSIITFLVLIFSTVKNKTAYTAKVLGVYFAGLSIPLGLFAWGAYKLGFLWGYIEVTRDVMISFSGNNLPNGMAFPRITSALSKGPLMGLLELIKNPDYLGIWLFLFYLMVTWILVVLNTKKRLNVGIVLIYLYGISLLPIIISRPGIGHIYFVLGPAVIISVWLLKLTSGLLLKEKTLLARLYLGLSVFLIVLVFLRFASINRFRLRALYSEKTYFNKNANFNITKNQGDYIDAIKEYVDKNTGKKDFIFFLSNEPLLYLVVQRMNPTRYDLPYIAHTAEKRYEVLSDIMKHNTKLIFFDRNSWPVDGVSNKIRHPELMEYIQKKYTKTYLLNGRIEVYTLKK